MKYITLFSIITLLLSCTRVNPAEEVIRRFAGENVPINLELSLEQQDGCDVYQTSVTDGIITIKASSNIALCRGFYDIVRSNGAGICSWTGNRFDASKIPSAVPEKTTVSPFKHHYYFNVVTYGYTMPYWDWERWEREIDWMALHGIDMPLALVANEAISARVWKKLGLSDEQINEYFVAPAHLPWMRMGNISGVDGPLPQEWHKGQIKLQHKILKRMKSLGMKPICPGFAGFVPKEIQEIYPETRLTETSWCDGAFHNWMLSPQDPLFQQIGRMFIEEWEKEFGRNEYYIVDSFNEMDIPFPPKGDPQRYSMLADYGQKVYSSIKAGNPDAVWVMQGWMFGYQRYIWDKETLGALVSKVPDDKMLLLDLAVDYNKCFWHNEVNWEYYDGLFGKEWIYSVIPNMGGKSGMTGILEFYANAHLNALNSPEKGNLAGYGMAPEGIENNEVIYELICDAGWSRDSIDVKQYLTNYSACRYGDCPESVNGFWEGMMNSVYGSFTDHPRYNWQFRPGICETGSININNHFLEGIEKFAQASTGLAHSELYNTDLIELTAQYIGARMELLIRDIYNKYRSGEDTSLQEKQFESYASTLDRLLCSHPCLRMENWISYARSWGATEELSDYYERNARRIVTVWGPPVDDYSARIWSGLVRDYYLPRWKHFFNQQRTGEKFDFQSWELDWVENTKGLSQAEPFDDPVSACLEILKTN